MLAGHSRHVPQMDTMQQERVQRFSATAAMVLLGLFAYANMPSDTFIHESAPLVRDNVHLSHFHSLSELISQPLWRQHNWLAGRPLLSLSFALGRLLPGDEAWNCRAINLALHMSSALFLFGLLHRILTAWWSPQEAVAIATASRSMG